MLTLRNMNRVYYSVTKCFMTFFFSHRFKFGRIKRSDTVSVANENVYNKFESKNYEI